MRPEVRGPEINVTPLVDVVLVLLIIFMVVVPQLDAGAAVTPPTAHHPDGQSELDEAHTLIITAQGGLFLDRAELLAADVERVLRDRHRSDPHRPLRIKGDRAVPYRIVRDVYRASQVAGFPGVGLEIGSPEDDSPGAEGS